MMHVTVRALRMVLFHDYPDTGPADDDGWPEWHLACDWTSLSVDYASRISCIPSGEVLAIVEGRTRNDVTCPQCAVLLDMAMELRGTS